MKSYPELCLFVTAIATAIGCAADPSEPIPVEEPAEPAGSTEPTELAFCPAQIVDVDRSLFVSPTAAAEQAALRGRFPVSRIMKHILLSAGTPRPVDGTELFRRWWDTQNNSGAPQFPDNPHCNDNGSTINGFPVQCPRNEGALATALPDSHFPIALVYRPDLAPRDGSTCGEARIVISKPNDATGRNFSIFEARIPNPDPSCGLNGCRKIAQFWARLSSVADFNQRLDALERFYFFGLNQAQDGVTTAPVLNATNLGLPGSNGARLGQIRTNQFMGPNPLIWQLREFKLNITCPPGLPCKLFFEPVSDKTNPWGALFNDNNPHPLGPAFRNELLGQLLALSPQDVNAIGMSTTNTFNAGQSNASASTENNYGVHFGSGNPAGFRQAIFNQLAALGIPRTPEEMVTRATTQSCAGCHQLSNNVLLGGLDASGNPLRWPLSLGFVHVREDGVRSPALNNVFLPKRKQILEQFLVDSCNNPCPVAVESDPTPLAGKATVH